MDKRERTDNYAHILLSDLMNHKRGTDDKNVEQ